MTIHRDRAVRFVSSSSRRLAPLAWAAALALGGCGGNVNDAPAGTSSTAAVADSFPTGLSVGVPTDISATATASSSGAQVSGLERTRDFGRALWAAAANRDGRTLARLASAVVPVGSALAGTVVEPGLKAEAAMIEKLASGTAGVSLADVLNLGHLFGDGRNASCYGPNMLYASHDDGADFVPAQLPGGDLGLWLATEGSTSQPCVAAQINARVSGIKGRTRQGLLMMAVMRRAATTLPAAGATEDIQTAMQAVFAAVPALAAVTVDAATVALATDGTVYTYRLVISTGSGAAAVSGEVLLKHTPGASRTAYSGILQVAGFHLSNDAAFSCTDETDTATGRFKVAQVSTLRYSRDADAIEFGSRDGKYCGHASAADATSPGNFAAQVASFTGDGQIDPAVKLGGSGTLRAGAKGWRAGFTRFAGAYNKTTVAGDFLFAWQAGPNDSHARAMAAHADFNSATEVRTLDGYFAFSADVGTTDGALLGMVCNWAGPGNNHVPAAKFQSQTATLTASATEYALGSSRITYAPTRSCSASATMRFDANADATLAAGEGASTVDALDVPTGARTVQQEIDARGFSKPAMF
jgi:hypothetical protein